MLTVSHPCREETFNNFGDKLDRKTVVHNWYVLKAYWMTPYEIITGLLFHRTDSQCNHFFPCELVGLEAELQRTWLLQV
jgi:hypothetical protein